LWRPHGGSVALIRRQRHSAQKRAEIRRICGKKDTAGLPQRGTSI
jgi:hypothetical protein